MKGVFVDTEIRVISIICVLLVFHFLFDFVFQERFIAKNKHRDFLCLLFHGMMYSTGLLIACLFIKYFSYQPLDTAPVFLFVFINSISHMIIDGFTSRRYAKLAPSIGRDKVEYKIVVNFGLDQALHTILLAGTSLLIV